MHHGNSLFHLFLCFQGRVHRGELYVLQGLHPRLDLAICGVENQNHGIIFQFHQFVGAGQGLLKVGVRFRTPQISFQGFHRVFPVM